MPKSVDRFLRHRTGVSRKGPALGRTFNVTRETWSLTDDPQVAPPVTELAVSRRTASDAADLARGAAEAFPRHGFHKPSGAWWGADEARFHRFVVHSVRQKTAAAVLLLSGLAGLLALGLARNRARSHHPRPRSKKDRPGGWGLERYSPSGQLLDYVRLPVPNVTKAAFGGADLTTLFITTACLRMTPAQRAAHPRSGGLFKLKLDVPGLPQHRIVRGL